MEWLEFKRWSEDVKRAMQARLKLQQEERRTPAAPATCQSREQLDALLRSHPATNPWGHPSEKN
jgi:hypothetical protein